MFYISSYISRDIIFCNFLELNSTLSENNFCLGFSFFWQIHATDSFFFKQVCSRPNYNTPKNASDWLLLMPFIYNECTYLLNNVLWLFIKTAVTIAIILIKLKMNLQFKSKLTYTNRKTDLSTVRLTLHWWLMHLSVKSRVNTSNKKPKWIISKNDAWCSAVKYMFDQI